MNCKLILGLFNSTINFFRTRQNAIGWVQRKEARTNHDCSERNTKLFDLVERAVKWLNEKEYENEILKWETKALGENPADFGRK